MYKKKEELKIGETGTVYGSNIFVKANKKIVICKESAPTPTCDWL